MYVDGNPKTKKELRALLASGQRPSVFQPGGIFPWKTEGTIIVEGPHYPKPHTWDARVLLESGRIVKVLG